MQQATAFPAGAASSLISGYCSDFVEFAATMAQTLEQVSMRELPLGDSRAELARVEQGMRQLAEAIGGLLSKTIPEPVEPEPKRRTRGHAPPPTRVARPLGEPAPLQIKPRIPHYASEGTGAEARQGPRPMPVAPVGDSVPPVDDGVKPPHPSTVDAGQEPQRRNPVSMLQGSNDTMPLRSVFQFLRRMRKNGTLRVTTEDEEMLFDLSNGHMIASSSTNPPENERLGDLLVELGLVDPAIVAEFTQQHGHSMRQLAGALIAANHLNEHQLVEALELQVWRRFRRAVALRHAGYTFQEHRRHARERIRIRPPELSDGGDAGGK